MGKKAEKAQQRENYRRAFVRVKHNHGGLSIKKKDIQALGKK